MGAGEENMLSSASEELSDEIIALIFKSFEGSPTDYSEEEIRTLDIFEDLNFDSIMLVDLLILLEETYGIELTDDMSALLENMDCMEKFVEYIGEKVQNA